MIFQLWPPQKQTPIASTEMGIATQYFFKWCDTVFKLLKGTLGVGIGQSTPTTVVLAKITTGGTNGSLTVVNGVITAYVAPT